MMHDAGIVGYFKWGSFKRALIRAVPMPVISRKDFWLRWWRFRMRWTTFPNAIQAGVNSRFI